MKKSSILVMAVCILGLGVLAGCATGPKGPTDQELITQTVTQLKDALFAGDSEKLLACFSEDFSHYEVPDKQTLADYVQMGVDMGYIDQLEEQNAVMEFAEAEIKIEGDTATMYPIEASADAGSVTVELTLKKEADGVWRIVTADVEGI